MNTRSTTRTPPSVDELVPQPPFTSSSPSSPIVPFWMSMKEDEWRWNFAYGSNMDPAVYQKRRQLNPKDSLPAFLPGYRMVFNVYGLPPVEPAFANVEPEPSKTKGIGMYGVLHLLNKQGWKKLQETEGGGGVSKKGYLPQEVTCKTFDGKEITAYALMVSEVPPLSAYLPPSSRYLTIVQKGAKYFSLPASYHARLMEAPKLPFSIFSVLVSIFFFLPVLPIFIVAFGGFFLFRRFGFPSPSGWLFPLIAPYRNFIYSIVTRLYPSASLSSPLTISAVRNEKEERESGMADEKKPKTDA